jgi:hypothetical protein
MARIIYSGLVSEIRGSIQGTTFQRNAYGFTAKAKSIPSRTRTASQQRTMQALQAVSYLWSTIPQSYRDSYEAYALNYPEYSKHNPSATLSGRDLFFKRNVLASIWTDLVLQETPLSTYPAVTFLPYLQTDGTTLLFFHGADSNFTEVAAVLQCSAGLPEYKYASVSQLRYIGQVYISQTSTDITALYLSIFHKIPTVGEWVYFSLQSFSKYTAAVYPRQFVSTVVQPMY